MNSSDKRVKTEVGNEVDRISSLPDHLRESILACLDIKGAMRTNVLSRKWRYCWTGLRTLDFNNMEEECPKKFGKAVDRALLLHSGPIHYFWLTIPHTGNHSKFNVSDWFHVLSKNGIQYVFFDACYTDTQDCPLPSSFFQCRDLKSVVLYYCTVTVPLNFRGFHILVDLEINFCKLPSHILGSLISQCPLLEELSLTCTCTEYREQPLVLDAINLRAVHYEDNLLGTIIFKNVPSLAKVSFSAFDIDVKDLERPCTTWGFMCSLSSIEELKFDILLLGPVISNCPICFPTIFQNLKTMTLRSVNAHVEDDMRFVLCLIRSSPGLQDLTIYLDSDCRENIKLVPEPEKSREAAHKLLETEAKENCKLSNLVTVAVNWIEGSRHEIMLVKILLSRCPNLQSFEVTPDAPEIHEELTMQLTRELKKFPYKDKLIYRPRYG